MLRNGRHKSAKYPDPEGGVTGGFVFNLVFILMEPEINIFHGIILACEPYPFFHAVDEAGPEGILPGAADMQVSHVGIQVCLPLGVISIRIDSCADIIQLHFGRIPDVDAVDLDRKEQQQEGEQHVDGEDNKNGEGGKVAAFIL